jgi:hypothetical protein
METSMENENVVPEVMAQQLVKANICLDTAELISIRGIQARCVAQATEAQNAVANWLRNGACPEDRAAEVEDGLRKLSKRIALQAWDTIERA